MNTNPDHNSVFIQLKDHSVSGESFELIHNEGMCRLETSPQPSLESLPKYYQSEDYISHTDGRRNLFEKVYHQIKSVALNQKLRLINSFRTESKTLLDIGCGTGDFLQICKKNGWTITGIEPDQNARTLAKTKTKSPEIFHTTELLNLPKHSFDVITLWHVLEHLPNLDNHAKVIQQLLKPNGRVVVAVPNYQSYDARYYKQFWAAYDVPRHLWHFSQEGISKLFQQVDIKVIKTKPMWFDAFYVSLLSEKYKTGKMNFINGFWVGLCSNWKAIRSKEASSLIYVLKNIENLK
ncbi:class I SAM-dependent methyltransferase [Winogradskyella maritima]|uniref:Class I SAM-dependent methyltransferase n=1 Tax=Winogradskyella maritima TaxID=1517766 RepID=A0ABV8AE51_9FLAO|nr:class I SAM-dependent methyltransferase [Winogradskyella maritima]